MAQKMKKPVVRFADVNLNEDEDMADGEERNSDDSGEGEEEDEEDGEDGEFIDVLDVLDGRGEVDTESSAEHRPKFASENGGRNIHEAGDEAEEPDEDFGEKSEDDSEEESDDDSDSMDNSSENDDDKFAFTPSDIEDAVPEALDELQNFISALDPAAKKRKALDRPDASSGSVVERSRKQRRLSLKERTEAGAENEFRAQNSGPSVNSILCL